MIISPTAGTVASAGSSPFSGLDLCAALGFRLPPKVAGPVFDDDVWSFADVIGMARYISPGTRRLDFTVFEDPGWRRLAKEYIAALMLPGHDAVAVLPGAYRAALGLVTCRQRLDDLRLWLRWLTERGITSLGEVGQHECDAYLIHVAGGRSENGADGVARNRAHRSAAQVIIELGMYSELFTDDRYAPDFRPFKGRSAHSVVGGKPRGANSTPTVPAEIFQPMLAAALYVANTLGPHVAALRSHWREQYVRAEQLPSSRRVQDYLPAIRQALGEHVAENRPLPQVVAHQVTQRIQAGWSPADPLLEVSFSALAQHVGLKQLHGAWWEHIRDEIEDALAQVGTAKQWGRDAALVARADGDGQLPWTEPLDEREVRDLAGVALAATILVVAAVSGMRASELSELDVGCRSVDELRPGLVRYRLASRVVKGQPMGGTADEWVVIREAHEAVGVAEQLLEDDSRADGAPLFGRISFADRYARFRSWVNGPAGQRLGLAPIPDGVVTLRMLRRTLAVELAYRPGGLLAAKIALKHVSVATTEGYAARPGGAQAKLLAEVSEQEQDRNLELLLEEWRNYQDGVMPAGPGARELVQFFDGVDGQLAEFAKSAPKTAATDQELRNLLTRRAKVLHLGTGNYCWFSDPSRALCLKLAGTPTADRPLIGMCDSARCPQATHHPRHRPVWADAVEKNTVFLGNLGASRKTERRRLEVEVARAARVVAEIDAAAMTTDDEEGVA